MKYIASLLLLFLIAACNLSNSGGPDDDSTGTGTSAGTYQVSDVVNLKNDLARLEVFLDDETDIQKLYKTRDDLEKAKAIISDSAGNAAIDAAKQVFEELSLKKAAKIQRNFENTFHVNSESGNDSANGSEAQPFKSLQKAISVGIEIPKNFIVLLESNIQVSDTLNFFKTDRTIFGGIVKIKGKGPERIQISPTAGYGGSLLDKGNLLHGDYGMGKNKPLFLEFENIAIKDFKSSPFSMIENTRIFFQNCLFEANQGNEGTIDGYDSAVFYIKNSVFKNNNNGTSTIFLHRNCKAYIEDTIFQDNKTKYNLGSVVFHEDSKLSLGPKVIFENNVPAGIASQGVRRNGFDNDLVEMFKTATFRGENQAGFVFEGKKLF